MWFLIKMNPSFINGSRHLFKAITLIRNCSERVQNIVKPVIQQNAFFAHPESILLSLINDPSVKIKRDGLNKIFAARRKKIFGVRKFQVPEINFQAATYPEIINWKKKRKSHHHHYSNSSLTKI